MKQTKLTRIVLFVLGLIVVVLSIISGKLFAILLGIILMAMGLFKYKSANSGVCISCGIDDDQCNNFQDAISNDYCHEEKR